jgi:lipoate-protein ligase B
MTVPIHVYNLGRLNYSAAYGIQKYFLDKSLADVVNQKPVSNTLLIVEHDPVYTIGIRRSLYKKEADLRSLADLNASVEYTDRGGLITFHGPGQLVAYPILNLKDFKPSVKWYVSRLEQVVIDMCLTGFGLKAYRICESGYNGVWVQDRKIAALGIHCKKYITYHGLSLNCNVDLNWFEHIEPCGIKDKQVTSLTNELKTNCTLDHVMPLFLNAFKANFSQNLIVQDDQATREIIQSVSEKKS